MGTDEEDARRGESASPRVSAEDAPRRKRKKRTPLRERGSEAAPAEPPPSQPVTWRRQTAQLAMLVVVVGAGVWLWFEYGSVDARKRRYIVSAQSMSAHELVDAYKSDAVAAHRRFKGDVVKVSGVVSKHDPWCVLCLDAGIECPTLDEEAKLYRAGQRSTVVGTVDDWSESAQRVRLGRCYVVE